MHKYNSITTLDFTSIQLYNIVIDVESYPLFLPWCLSSKLVSKVNKNNFDASLTVGYKAIDENYTSRIEAVFSKKIRSYAISGPFKYLDSNWFFNDMMRQTNRKYNLLNKHQNIEKIPSIEEIPDIEKLQYRTKIILLNELGIIDFLKKRESFQSNTDLSKFITKIIVGKNEDEKSVYNTIRTDLSYLNQPNNNKSPYTESQKRIVNSILSTFSLPNIK